MVFLGSKLPFLIYSTQVGERTQKAPESFPGVPTDCKGLPFWGLPRNPVSPCFSSSAARTGVDMNGNCKCLFKNNTHTNLKSILNYLFCAFTFHCGTC